MRSLVITLCGSARFEHHFKLWNKVLTQAGHAVFSLSVYPSDEAGVKEWYSPEVKAKLDTAHKLKITKSDAILLLNCFGYIGPSTQVEVEHARYFNKQLFALESWGQGRGVTEDMHTSVHCEDARRYGLELPTRSPIGTTSWNGFAGPWDLLGPSGEERNRLLQILKGG